MRIRNYQAGDEKGWIYTKALAYLFSPFFDDRDSFKPELDKEVFEERLELVAEEDGQIVGLLDIDIYNQAYSRTYRYAPANKVAYFSNLAVHPDYQGRGIAQVLFDTAKRVLKEKDVEKLSIFTRDGNAANHLYQKWGGQLVCQDWLVIGNPKAQPAIQFGVDLEAGRLHLSSSDGSHCSYYQREGIYVVADEASLEQFNIEKVYQEFTYVIDLLVN
ncbi:N-acetyltransferase family protein [Streptococcus ictaluri]|uniref:FR47-like protein n=1 Tax=Streptococcus ictaluri 707-05 TaxID=764299 RepID=G5JZV8_9STRE|nr:GNAT family N-acetyltransferase [Streptococcus ictaluri]EHI70873.1 FR47-like protein [Streptococcus ictaluri 707-05]